VGSATYTSPVCAHTAAAPDSNTSNRTLPTPTTVGAGRGLGGRGGVGISRRTHTLTTRGTVCGVREGGDGVSFPPTAYCYEFGIGGWCSGDEVTHTNTLSHTHTLTHTNSYCMVFPARFLPFFLSYTHTHTRAHTQGECVCVLLGACLRVCVPVCIRVCVPYTLLHPMLLSS